MTKQFLAAISLASLILTGCGNKADKQKNGLSDSTAVEQSAEDMSAKEKTTASVYGVDLGLSVNWEASNFGAQTPGEAGIICDISKVAKDDGWRLPTDKEWSELISKCEWTDDELDGMKGARIMASNGNSIFLPACGMPYERVSDSMTTADSEWLSDVGSEGNYWCTSDDYFNMMAFHTSPVRAQMMIIDYSYLLAARRVHDK